MDVEKWAKGQWSTTAASGQVTTPGHSPTLAISPQIPRDDRPKPEAEAMAQVTDGNPRTVDENDTNRPWGRASRLIGLGGAARHNPDLAWVTGRKFEFFEVPGSIPKVVMFSPETMDAAKVLQKSYRSLAEVSQSKITTLRALPPSYRPGQRPFLD
ncbi:hypothetical protein PROH_18000 [Prochlorothrix hollandica PCC 9006 = CALU 1027]|uniref:Uncharacterized protein n=1 Tax=Prochlorothrix hollandica PCC 9006 = CALU 1027 TaxID=317619 RepID=A0A0M2PUE1_PROHO|nr:hypothetical protein PROH_18000 [Prochlorothrix hollandica PCC 9006 = CALU 1027]